MKNLDELDKKISKFKEKRENRFEEIDYAKQALRQPSLILIDHRNLVRDCLAISLANAFPYEKIIALPSAADLFKSSIKLIEGDLIILYYDTQQNSQREAARDELLSRVDHGIDVALICEGDDVRDVMGCLDDGARGYIPTNVSLQVAIEAIRLVRAGGIFIPANSLLQFYSSATDLDPPRQFTPRQTDVLGQLQKGKSNKIIAFELQMKESTVKVHVRNIMRRLGVTNRTEAVVEMQQNCNVDYKKAK
jgi:DNA-binding NarL/FixJ family response regulator